MITMTLQAQECPQAQADVIAPRPTRAHLRPLDQTVLFHSPMIMFDRPRKVSPLYALQAVHLGFVRRPVFNVTVCGDNLEHTNQTIPLQPYDPSELPNLDHMKRTRALTV